MPSKVWWKLDITFKPLCQMQICRMYSSLILVGRFLRHIPESKMASAELNSPMEAVNDNWERVSLKQILRLFSHADILTTDKLSHYHHFPFTRRHLQVPARCVACSSSSRGQYLSPENPPKISAIVQVVSQSESDCKLSSFESYA
jgi:hypothetical protein